MPSPTTIGGSRITRVSTMAALTKTKMEGEPKKQEDPGVKDTLTAINFLMEGDFKSEDNEMSFKLLGVIEMQLSQQLRNLKMVSEAFKALSYLIFDIHQKNTVVSITDSIEKSVSTATKRIQDELAEATDQLVLATTKSTEAGKNLKSECQEAINKLKEVMEEAGNAIKETNIRRTDREDNENREKRIDMPKTYMDSVRNNIPTPHVVAVARAITQKRKIRLVKAIGMVGEGMVELLEKQLVEKANMVLVLMVEGEERRPIEVRFVGANKERGSGGVTYIKLRGSG